MNVTHYYFERGHCNVLKSKLHKAVEVYLASHDRNLIEASQLPELKEVIRKEVELINAKYPRCKAVKLCFESFGYRSQTFITGIQGMSFILKSATLSHPTSFASNHE
jgi:hypothetical protein